MPVNQFKISNKIPTMHIATATFRKIPIYDYFEENDYLILKCKKIFIFTQTPRMI